MTSESITDHFEAPRNAGEIEDPDAAGRAENPVCGDEVRATFRIGEGVVREMRYRVYGCHATVAVMSLLSERVAGLPLERALALTPDEVRGWFAGFPRGKAHAAELAVDLIRDALGGHR